MAHGAWRNNDACYPDSASGRTACRRGLPANGCRLHSLGRVAGTACGRSITNPGAHRLTSDYPDVVIFLPGIGGSSLHREGRPLWGGSWRAMANAVFRGGLAELALDVSDPDADDGVSVGGLIDDVQILPGLWKIEAYGDFCRTLTSSVGLAEGENFFRFPYDWRRDIRSSSAKLARHAEAWLHAWRRKSGNADARTVFVAHSMGGLVARHYVECMEGWKTTRRLVSLGTPYRGSLNALGCLVNGYARGIGPLRVDATAPLRSFMSVHQLLPTYPCIDDGSGLLRVRETTLPGIDSRSSLAAEFHAQTTNAAAANSVLTGYPTGYLSCLVSSRQPTFQSARRIGERLELVGMLGQDDHGGDGTVPAVSAVPVGFDRTSAHYAWGLHSALANQDDVREHVLGALRSIRVDEDRYRASGDDRRQIMLRLDDAYVADQPFELIADLAGRPEQTLLAKATPIDGVGEVRSVVLHREAAGYVGPLTLTEGAWRIEVEGLRSAPVQDITLALPGHGELAEVA